MRESDPLLLIRIAGRPTGAAASRLANTLQLASSTTLISVDDVDLEILQASPTADPRIEWLYAQIQELNTIDRSLTLSDAG